MNKDLPQKNLWDLAEQARAGEILSQLYNEYGGEGREELKYIVENGVSRLASADRDQEDIVKYYELVNWPVSIEEAVNGIDVNKINERGQTILHEIILRPNYEIEAKLSGINKEKVVAKLLRAGANPDITARADGWGAIHLAVKSVQVGVTKLFVKHLTEQQQLLTEQQQLLTEQEELTAEQVKSLRELIIPYESPSQAMLHLLGEEAEEARDVITELKPQLETLLHKYEELEVKIEECEMMGVLMCKSMFSE